MFIHEDKQRLTYWQMASTLKKHAPELKHVRVFGTDGDPSLYQAFAEVFAEAQHLLCDIHMRDNIEKKLRQLNERSSTIRDVVEDIFGKKEEAEKTAGLVDCTDSTFETERDKLYEKWLSVMEKGEQFVQYFKDNKEDKIRNCMLLSTRIACHLNLDVYTQNANECMNSVIRKETEMKKMKLTPFIIAMKRFVDKQEKNIEQTVLEMTEGLRLLERYKHLAVSRTDFYRL